MGVNCVLSFRSVFLSAWLIIIIMRAWDFVIIALLNVQKDSKTQQHAFLL